MRASLTAVPTRRPRLVAALALLLAGIALLRIYDIGDQRLNLPIDASLTGLLPTRGAELATYARVRDQFGGDDVLFVAWFDDNLFSRDALRRIKRFSRAIRRLDGVERVDGLATALHVREVGEDIRIDRLLKRIPRRPEALDALREVAVTSPLYGGQFVSGDGKGALFAVHFETGLGSPSLRTAVRAIVAAADEHAGDIEHFVTGPVEARLRISDILFRDISRALPLAIVITAIIAAFTLRNLRGVILPLLSTGSGLIITLAVFVGTGQALNFVTAIVPPVIFVIGFAFAIHVVTEFDHRFTSVANRGEAVTRTIGEVFQPLTLTAVTTTIGFASPATSSIESIRLFGLFTALGTALCWMYALLVIPALLLVAPVRPARRRADGGLVRFAPALARFNLRHRRAILTTGAVIAVMAVVSAAQLEVSTDYLRNFPTDSPTTRNFERVRGEFAGAVPLQILLESDVPGAFSDPLSLGNLAALESWLEEQPEIGNAVSLVDFTRVLYHAFEPDTHEGRAFPPTAAEVEDLYFFAGGDELERFVDNRRLATVMHIQTSAVATRELVDLIQRIDARLAQLPDYMRGEVTGSSALLALTLDDIVRGQVTSLLGAMLVIYIILIVLFGSARVAALALLPNMLPIACFFALLGLTGITLNLATSLVAAVVLGIAVDDTMHFLSRFNAAARERANEAEGLEYALSAVIRPVTFTTLALCCGFLTLTRGELTSQVEFGALAAATLLIAWVIDLTFTPALAGKLRFVTLWEVLTLDLGAAPHQTIPFFSGLTNRQARIAAILGTMRSIDRGDAIVRQGESGRDIHIVIEGEAVAYVGRDDKEQILRRLKRGDLIGEVALFHGERTANVDATSPMRVLRFEDACLARIESRYPRIGAQLYKNLGVILADRLADITERL